LASVSGDTEGDLGVETVCVGSFTIGSDFLIGGWDVSRVVGIGRYEFVVGSIIVCTTSATCFSLKAPKRATDSWNTSSNCVIAVSLTN
jgi:hypothetical protein